MESGEKHDCPMDPYIIRKRRTIRARAVNKSAIAKIDDFQRIFEDQEYIAHVNSRLENYELILTKKQKQPIFGEEL
jgi:hypothetical protein